MGVFFEWCVTLMHASGGFEHARMLALCVVKTIGSCPFCGTVLRNVIIKRVEDE